MKYQKINILAITIMIWGMSLTNTFAQQAPQALETREISGEVLQLQNQTLTIKTDDGVSQIPINDNITISRDARDAQVQDLEPGDNVTITQTITGQVLGVESTSQTSQDVMQTALPLIGLVLLIGALALYAYKKANKGFIKTNTTRLQ